LTSTENFTEMQGNPLVLEGFKAVRRKSGSQV